MSLEEAKATARAKYLCCLLTVPSETEDVISRWQVFWQDNVIHNGSCGKVTRAVTLHVDVVVVVGARRAVPRLAVVQLLGTRWVKLPAGNANCGHLAARPSGGLARRRRVKVNTRNRILRPGRTGW